MDVGDFLRELGLQQYEAAFRDNRIDIRVVPKLTAEDLKDLGVTLIGDRRMLLDAIAALREPTAPGVKTGGDALDAGLIRGTEAATTAQAERRPLSVMFCDLIGSTALSSRLDPEDLREVIRMYQACVATTIGQFDGFIARYVGDGVLIYFGWPEAQETDAERAVRAGLAVAAAVSETPVGGEPLQVRIGIATGLVVIGDPIGSGDSRQQTAVGETPNIAARLQGLAGPGQVVIDAATRRQMGGLFEYRDLGNVALKGFAEDVPVWQVLGVGTAESRFEALHGTTTPLVGRDEELALLQRRWQQAKGGEGCVVLVSGEPGIGKSRLTQTLFERLAGEPHTRLRLFCSPHSQDSALYPTITQLERAAGFRREDTAAQRLDKLEAVLAQATNDFSEAAPLIAALLSLQARERYSPLDLIPQKQKEKTLRALVAQVEGLAVRQPVLMLFEDAHWSDPTSLELLDLIIDRVPGLPLLLIITFRPEFSPPWAGRPHVSWLGLNRLPPRQRAEMIAGVTGGKALPQEIAAQIIDRTDGVPLFVEELTKAVVESGMLTDAGDRYTAAGPATLLAIPASLQASLLARLDRLAPVREVAQIGAALGRQFSHELIGAVAPMPPAQLDDALVQLVRAELIYRRGTPPDAEYTFKHALVQDAAYSTLLRSRRQQLHARIAAILEARFPEIVTTQPEQLAHHFDAAGLTDPAIDYYRRAANRAIAASANLEAIVHLKRGLELFASLPASAERTSRELDFRLALGPPLIATQGWGSVEAEANYARAKVLGSEVGESAELFRSLVGLWVYEVCRPDRPDARRPLEASHELLLLAARLGGNDVSLLAEYTACVSCHWAGRFTETLSHAAQVFAIYDPEHHRGPKAFAADPAMVAMSFESMSLWYLGYPDRAHQRGLAALSMDRAVAHPFSLCWVLWQEVCLRILRREPELIAARAEAHLALAREQGFPLDCSVASMFEIWCEAQATGRCEEDRIEAFRNAQSETMTLGFSATAPIFAILLAQCLQKKGHAEGALAALEAAVVQIDSTGYNVWEPEVYRSMGDLLLQLNSSASAKAEVSYRRAIERARSQEAKSWELRAATSLARLWERQGKRVEARDLLSPIYHWFTEGFDTRDLMEAKALLDELA